MFDPAGLVFIDCTNTAMMRLRGRAPRGERLVGYAHMDIGKQSPSWAACGNAAGPHRLCSKEP